MGQADLDSINIVICIVLCYIVIIHL